MDWIETTVFTTTEGIEPVTGRLYRLSVQGTQIADESEFNEFLEQNHRYWDYVDDALRLEMAGETRVIAYLTDNETGRAMLAAIRESMEELRAADPEQCFGRLAVTTGSRREEDWADNWKRYFKPLDIGDKLRIQPAWEPLDNESLHGRTVFTVEPGMVFGTGAHESTRMCIAAAERHVQAGAQVLDLGCGSGILSIIALLLGAQNALAIDIDPNAVDVAYANAARNGVGRDRYTVLSGDVLTDADVQARIVQKRYDVVFANIVADVILALAPLVPPLLTPDGVFIVSGIIEPRREEVAAGLQAQGFAVLESIYENGWAAFVCAISR